MRSYAVEHYIGSFVGNWCSVVYFRHQVVHDAYMEKTGSHCGSSIRCLNGGRSCACIWMYNNVPNHWFFYLVWVYTFELSLPSFARLCPQNHMSKLYAQSHTPTAKPYAENHMPKTIRLKPYAHRETICLKPNHTPKTMRPKSYAQKPYTQSQTIRPKSYTQNHMPKTIRQRELPKTIAFYTQ